jgi:putative transposase
MADAARRRHRPLPDRTTTTWSAFLHSQAHALLAADFVETVTVTGVRLYILAVIERSTRRIRALDATPHPTATWVTQTTRNLTMDLHDTTDIGPLTRGPYQDRCFRLFG